MILGLLALVTHLALAQDITVLTDLALLKELKISPQVSDPKRGIAIAQVTAKQEAMIAHKAHEWGRCGGYENITSEKVSTLKEKQNIIDQLGALMQKAEKLSTLQAPQLEKNPAIQAAIDQVKAEEIEKWIKWFSAYPSRYNKSSTANDHVNALKIKIEEILKKSPLNSGVDLISHRSTPQKSVRVYIEGQKRPQEIIVLGAHMDSINMAGGFFPDPRSRAPGVDDNASGSSNLLEALRILLTQKAPDRSIEIFWYAGEESGLLGSSEIAQNYKTMGKDVIAALQLDMTLMPGDGPFVLASMTDFTSPWLRGVLVELNRLYINARIIEDKCGYGCSDHASWFRQGYPTLMPFESSFNRMNQNIHTERDVIDSTTDFAHSAIFSKIAVALSMELANSTQRQP